MMNVQKRILGIVVFLLICSVFVSAEVLEKGFQNPPQSAHPKTWFHCMSANMSAEGLTKDLESIADVGIGGVLMFNVTQGIPIGNVPYNSPEHRDLIKHAAMECERLGLSFGVHNCDGWSSSGGPWVTPEDSMKMVVHTRTITDGGKIDLQLPTPPTREGFYKDIAVLAYPALESDILDASSKPVVTASNAGFNTSVVLDNQIDQNDRLTKDKQGKVWLLYDYGQKHTISSVNILLADRDPAAFLSVSDDGVSFKKIKQLRSVRPGKHEWGFNDSFDPVEGRYFRLEFAKDANITEAKLCATTKMDNWFGRTSLVRTDSRSLGKLKTPDSSMILKQDDILDLSSDMNQSGRLKTQLPAGKWTILRFGFTSTSARNHPASEEGRGLECDKLCRKAFKKHYEAFVAKVIKESQPVAKNALQYMEIDSYEMGGQNWTDDLPQVFKKAKGYEIVKFLPLFAGYYIDSPEVSEDILWDVRDVICDMMTENYFGYFTELCNKDGIKTYIEPYGNGPLNDLDVGGKADMTMGEFWMNRDSQRVHSAVSSARIYGKKVISAESFTSRPEVNWKGHPGMAKETGDRAWVNGVNEFMFHRFAHQANTRVMPGMTMNRWGFHFDRTQTWWTNAGAAWFDYIARGSYLLQQGVSVSDLLIFVGDTSPNSTAKGSSFDPDLPSGYKYDSVNADVLINRIKCEDGLLKLPEGTTYKILALEMTEQMSLETLKGLWQLSKDGAVIVGKRPVKLAGYKKTPEQLKLFKQYVNEIWGCKTTYSDSDWESIFKNHNVKPDLLVDGRQTGRFIHRRVDDTDIYFIYNADSKAQTLNCQFYVDGKVPELWNPMDGSIVRAAAFSYDAGYTKVPVRLEAKESVFVVFKQSSTAGSSVKTDQAATMLDEMVIDGPWSVSFDAAYGGFTGRFKFPQLIDWKTHSNEEIKYYSGTAVYRKTFALPEDVTAKGNRLLLDLGQVEIAAEIKLNGQDLGVVWMAPYRLDITNAVSPGQNVLEIAVTNLWANRLIGDAKLPDHDKYSRDSSVPKQKMSPWYVNNEPMPKGPRRTFCTGQFYRGSEPLLSSGLIGPVKISVMK